MKKSKTILREFETNVDARKYTRCPKGIIIGSRDCKKCKHFIEKASDNIKVTSVLTGKEVKVYLTKGIVECSNV